MRTSRCVCSGNHDASSLSSRTVSARPRARLVLDRRDGEYRRIYLLPALLRLVSTRFRNSSSFFADLGTSGSSNGDEVLDRRPPQRVHLRRRNGSHSFAERSLNSTVRSPRPEERMRCRNASISSPRVRPARRERRRPRASALGGAQALSPSASSGRFAPGKAKREPGQACLPAAGCSRGDLASSRASRARHSQRTGGRVQSGIERSSPRAASRRIVSGWTPKQISELLHRVVTLNHGAAVAWSPRASSSRSP